MLVNDGSQTPLYITSEISAGNKKINFRKVPIEKVRFASRIDVIAHKLAPVASGEILRTCVFSLTIPV